MAIRERFRRALRRSDDSDTISQTESNTTTVSSGRPSSSSENTPPLSLKKTSSTLSRTLASLGFGEKDLEKEAAKEAARREARERRDARDRRRMKGRTRTYKHPSEKPLTEQNLKHQEMLSHFKMEFGASDPSQILQDLDFEGISPCCTRVDSSDLGPEDA